MKKPTRVLYEVTGLIDPIHLFTALQISTDKCALTIVDNGPQEYLVNVPDLTLAIKKRLHLVDRRRELLWSQVSRPIVMQFL